MLLTTILFLPPGRPAALHLPARRRLVLPRESEESLLECDVERADSSLLVLPGSLQILGAGQ